jgi:hypothetical protein
MIGIIFCYGTILQTVRQQSKRVFVGNDRRVQATSSDAENQRRRQELRVTKLSALIVVIFASCFLPNLVITLTPQLRSMCVVQSVGATFVSLHGAVDATVYLCGDSQMQRVLRRCRRRKKTSFPFTASAETPASNRDHNGNNFAE